MPSRGRSNRSRRRATGPRGEASRRRSARPIGRRQSSGRSDTRRGLTSRSLCDFPFLTRRRTSRSRDKGRGGMSGRRGARPAFGRTIVASASDRKRVNPAPSGCGGDAKSIPSRHGAHAHDPVAGEGGGPRLPAALNAPCEARAGFEFFQGLGETFPGDGHCQGGGPETLDASLLSSPRKRGSSALARARAPDRQLRRSPPWMPAFAGMTTLAVTGDGRCQAGPP